MAFDFPSSPTTGQTYSVTGGPTYVYNGTAWQVLTPGNQFNRTVFTATAGQTTFTMNYVVGAIDVYRNGVKLAPADFTATNGTSIVLANGCTVGDTVEVISYPMITYSDAVKRTGDTMTGALALPSGGLNVGSGQLQVDASGRVLQGSQPTFFAHTASGQTAILDTVIRYTTVLTNIGSCYNSSTGRFTAPVNGRYLFLASGMGDGSANRVMLRLQLNGLDAIFGSNAANYYGDARVYAVFTLSAGDYVNVIGRSNFFWQNGNSVEHCFMGQLLG